MTRLYIVPELVMALLDAAYDQDQTVRDSIKESLHNLGNKQSALVLSSALAYLHKHTKVMAANLDLWLKLDLEN